MKRQKIQCVVVDRDVEITASLDAAVRSSEYTPELVLVASTQQLVSVMAESRPHLLFCPKTGSAGTAALMEAVRRHSPDTLLVWISSAEWQGLRAARSGVESCMLPLNDLDYFAQYVDFLLHYTLLKQSFRQSKQLLAVAELRCHWLVDYSWEAIAYISQGAHLYANNAYLNLFGFSSIDVARSVPVAQLVDVDERRIFEALGRAADLGNRPSNRLLTTLRLLNGESVRAEIRFIPAVLKGKRCYQLHVRPINRQVKVNPVRQSPSVWDKPEQLAKTSLVVPPVTHTPVRRGISTHPNAATRNTGTAPKVASRQEGLQEAFRISLKLRERQPQLYFATPFLLQAGGGKLPYTTLLKQMVDPDVRFRLDYWTLGRVVQRLSTRRKNVSGRLVFVSVGNGIFNNDNQLASIVGLLSDTPACSRRIVLALQYHDCVANIRQFGKLVKRLQATGVRLGIDHVPDDPRLLKLARAVKPDFMRLQPALAANVSDNANAARHLHKLVHQLTEAGTGVIVDGVNDVATLSLACATSAVYLQGRIIKP